VGGGWEGPREGGREGPERLVIIAREVGEGLFLY